MQRSADFSESTKKTAALRAHYFCTNPNCHRLTIGPGRAASKIKGVGEAAHIYGASPKGPRYSGCPSETFRRSVKNALWLCRNCHRLVDTDWIDRPASQLLAWKAGHEGMVRDWLNTGQRGAIRIALGISSSDEDVARDFITFLSDRRVFFALYEFEVPKFVADSVVKIREELTNLIRRLPPESPSRATLDGLRLVCRRFLDEVGSLEERRRLKDFDWCEMDAFVASLAAFRKAFGVVLQVMSTQHSIALGEDLDSLIPQPPK